MSDLLRFFKKQYLQKKYIHSKIIKAVSTIVSAAAAELAIKFETVPRLTKSFGDDFSADAELHNSLSTRRNMNFQPATSSTASCVVAARYKKHSCC